MSSRRSFLTLSVLAFATDTQAQRALPREGEQFTVLKTPQPPSVAGKVEVLEFFSYACPHCFDFDPTLEKWRSRLPAEVSFRRVPVSFLSNHENFQRAYLALETLGQVNPAHARLFDAVHREHKVLSSPEAIAEVVAAAGVDSAKFLSTFKSFGMPALLSKATAATSAYEIDGVPTLAIGGRYLTSPAQAGGVQQALATADFLLQKVRKA